jgi:hypothetical protein
METPYYPFLCVLLLCLLYRLSRVGHRPKDYPRGPPTLPLLGNIHLVRAGNQLLSLRQLFPIHR